MFISMTSGIRFDYMTRCRLFSNIFFRFSIFYYGTPFTISRLFAYTVWIVRVKNISVD